VGDGVQYVGAFVDQKFQGEGAYIFPDGSRYFGQFKNGEAHGQGIYAFPDGFVYFGIFESAQFLVGPIASTSEATAIQQRIPSTFMLNKLGFPQGRFIPVWPACTLMVSYTRTQSYSPSTLPTTWTDCVGAVTLPNGYRYVGEFRNGYPDGQGAYFVTSNEQYFGTFGPLSPKTSFALPPAFSSEQLNGLGTRVYSDGSQYSGEFRNGEPHGPGTLTRINGSVFQTGLWENGTLLSPMEASARQNPVNTQRSTGTQNACPGSYDSSTWNNCVGAYTFGNGGQYVGEFRNDKFNGQGTYTYPDGSEYVGEFRNDAFNGPGTLTRADGSVQAGLWESNEFLEPQERVTENQTSGSGRFDVFNQTRQSAEGGDATAQYNLGQMYREGEGVPQNYVNAHAWWNVSSAFGHEGASENRSTVEELMTPSQIAEAQQLSTEIFERIQRNQ